MAIKANIRFDALSGGKRIRGVQETTTRNTVEEIRDRVIELVRMDYPDVTVADVIYQRKELEKGYWQIIAENNDTTLLLTITRL